MSRKKLILLYTLIAVLIVIGSYFLNAQLDPLQLSWRIIVIIFVINIFLIASVILLEKRNPYKTIAWLLVFIAFPIGGYVLYTFFGRNMRKERILKNLKDYNRCYEILATYRSALKSPDFDMPDLRINRLMKNSTTLPIQFYNNIKVLTNGPSTFREIIKELRKARDHIHMEYYIIRDDKLGVHIRNILIEKARQGVEIRILYDGVGSMQLTQSFFQPLREAGGQVHAFLPFKFPFLDYRSNYRNHRKILIVDGRAGFLGGLNIGDEYLGRTKAFQFWRDTHLKLEGDAVYSLQAVFMQDWIFAAGKDLDCGRYFPRHDIKMVKPVQIVASSPDSRWNSIQNLYTQLVSMAEKKLYITTPYLIPDESLLTALKLAALSDVDVRLLVPGIPDKKIVHWASRSYYEELMEAGVRIYEYTRGFIHAKVIQVDGKIASVGTANFDIRSLHLGYEVNALIFDEQIAKILEEDFSRDLKHCIEIDLKKWTDRPLTENLKESTARLFSPLL
ncbi:MAG: Cardiolipin synthetase [Firmicutes bacterium]|nr:Cardiolipin synthetase [Bacillota bacterium]MDI6706841.1 cardiolipin synthase [Bacillota bacterium]